MPSRRDQLHSYKFMIQRMTSAILVQETDPEQAPLRRGVGAAFAGLMIAVLIAGGFGVYGIFTGIGGTSWKTDGAVIIERETGSSYVYRDGRLRPTLNYASARLLGGVQGAGQGSEPHYVSGASLEGVPRLPAVGIAGAPDSLPPGDRVTGLPWSLCSVPGTNPAGAPVTRSTLLVGERPSGGRELGDRAVVASDRDTGRTYLLWRDHRYEIVGKQRRGVLRSVFGAEFSTVRVGNAWLNGIPSGQDIGPVPVDGRGQASAAVNGHRIGDVLYHPVGSGRQYYLVLNGGLAPLTEFQLRIVRGQYAVEPAEIPAAEANAAPSSDALETAGGDTAPPSDSPELASLPADGRTLLCAEMSSANSPPKVRLGGDPNAVGDGIATTGRTEDGVALADRIVVPPGRVAVTRVMPSGSAGSGALYLVTDTGLRFPVPSGEVLERLGYSPSDAVRVPAALVQRIPQGPTLDPAAARRPARIPSTGQR